MKSDFVIKGKVRKRILIRFCIFERIPLNVSFTSMVSITKESMCCCSNALQGVEEKISNLGLSNITLRVQGSATPVYNEHCDVWIY